MHVVIRDFEMISIEFLNKSHFKWKFRFRNITLRVVRVWFANIMGVGLVPTMISSVLGNGIVLYQIILHIGVH